MRLFATEYCFIPKPEAFYVKNIEIKIVYGSSCMLNPTGEFRGGGGGTERRDYPKKDYDIFWQIAVAK